MNSKIGGPGWDRTNDQPIMSPERSRPTRSSDVDPNTRRPETSPTSPPSSDQIDPIGSQDWQSNLGRDDSECTSTNLRVILPWADANNVGYAAWTWDKWSHVQQRARAWSRCWPQSV